MKRILLPMLLLLLIAACEVPGNADMETGLTVHFMDIDRNDGIVILCGVEAAFIDSGIYNFGTQAVEYLRAQGISHLKYYIGTHAHRDHVEGAAVILPAMTPDALIQPHDGVRQLILSGCRTEEERAAAERITVITARGGQVFRVGEATLEVLGPLQISAGDNENDNSLVLRLTYGKVTFLLTGDCPSDVMRRMEKANPGCLACTVLKNPHHNSLLDLDVFAACAPKYIVFTTSDGALPARAGLETVSDFGARAMVTAHTQNGTVIFHTDGEEITHSVERGPSKVTFADAALSLYVGQSRTERARMEPERYRAVTYESDNPDVAGVDGTGKITAYHVGETVIRAVTANELEAVCRITVMPNAVLLNRKELHLPVRGNDVLVYRVLPETARETVHWVSEDPTVATVNEKGRVVGIAPGTTRVHAQLDNGQEDICTVTVR